MVSSRGAVTCLVVALSGPVVAQVLEAPRAFPVTAVSPHGVLATGDVVRDGFPDLVLFGAGRIEVLPGDGTGNLGAPIVTPLPWANLTAHPLFLRDLDGDGDLDCCCSSHGIGAQSGMRVLFGDGTGAFVLGPSLPLAGPFAVTDFDGDGLADVVAFAPPANLQIAFGQPGGVFALPVQGVVPPLPQMLVASGLRVADFDGDRAPDVLVFGVGSTFVMRGNRTTTVADAVVVGPSAWNVVTPDVDVDGDLDIVIDHDFAGWRTLINGRDAWTVAPSVQPLPALSGLAQVACVDLDGDGIEDVVADGQSAIAVLFGDGVGGFGPPVLTASGGQRIVTTGDFDLDGRTDVAAVTAGTLSSAGTVSIYRNLLARPSGVASFGVGTAACRGRIGLGATRVPRIGTADLRIVCSNAPAAATGVVALGTKVVGGWQPFGLGVTFHLGWLAPIAVLRSGATGVASLALPIPPQPWLVGQKVYLQSFWPGDPGSGETCSDAWQSLSSSRGLSLTLSP